MRDDAWAFPDGSDDHESLADAHKRRRTQNNQKFMLHHAGDKGTESNANAGPYHEATTYGESTAIEAYSYTNASVWLLIVEHSQC